MAVKNNTYNIQEVGLAKALVRKGHICDIIFWTDTADETVVLPVENCGEVHVFYRLGKSVIKNTVYAGCEEMFSHYDVLQPAEYNQMQAWLLARKYPNKTVIYHGPYYSSFNKRYNLMCKVFDALFLKQYIKLGTRFLVKSGLAKQFLVKKGIKEENIRVVGVGIDTQMLSNVEVTCNETLYQEIKNDSSDMKLLYIGRFEERRDIPFIIDVFKGVLEKNPTARLYMVGTGDKEYVDMVFFYMEKVGVREKIVWQEKMEQKYLANIYRWADFFLLPTEYEIFGMVLLEAMYYGNVVLTTRNGGSSTLIQNGENGFIIRKDSDKWAECVVRLSDEKRCKIGKNASYTIKENFTWDHLASEFESEYSIVANRN